MDVVLVIGRVLFAILFARSGYQHLKDQGMMVGYARAKGVPMPETAIPLTGVILILGAVSLALGIYADIGALLLLIFLVPTALIMHDYWAQEDPEAKAADSIHFYKDTALAGAAVIIFYLYNQGQDIPASITHALLGKF